MKLYQYRPINEYTQKILTHNELFFNSPDNFNDPYDTYFDIEGINITSKKKDNMLNAVREKTRICCFSRRCDNILMWSHYADKHKGLCIEFDTLYDSNDITWKKLKLKVNYKNNELSKLNLGVDSHEGDKHLREVFAKKSVHWKYEKETRLIKIQGENEKFLKYVYTCSSKAITGVIFGAKMAYKDKVEYFNLNLIKDKKVHSKFKFYEATISKTKYEVERNEL